MFRWDGWARVKFFLVIWEMDFTTRLEAKLADFEREGAPLAPFERHMIDEIRKMIENEKNPMKNSNAYPAFQGGKRTRRRSRASHRR